MTRKFTSSELQKFVRKTAAPFVQEEIDKAIGLLRKESVNGGLIEDIINSARNSANRDDKQGHGLTEIIRARPESC